jgi:hypothetical protein
MPVLHDLEVACITAVVEDLGYDEPEPEDEHNYDTMPVFDEEIEGLDVACSHGGQQTCFQSSSLNGIFLGKGLMGQGISIVTYSRQCNPWHVGL